MGSNYYFRMPSCPVCGQSEGRHIGKSSVGWHFAVHVYPDDGICTLEDWKALWTRGGEIHDDCGRIITAEEMLGEITCRSRERPPEGDPSEYGPAEVGHNNLLRHRRDTDANLYAHGEGTYDYFTGNFS
jgi:hypothetical protein